MLLRSDYSLERLLSPESWSNDAPYKMLACILVVYSVIVLAAPLVTPECHIPPPKHPWKYKNPDYTPDPCRYERYAVLGGMTSWECEMCTRSLISLVTGTLIGWERRRGDRPAGIRWGQPLVNPSLAQARPSLTQPRPPVPTLWVQTATTPPDNTSPNTGARANNTIDDSFLFLLDVLQSVSLPYLLCTIFISSVSSCHCSHRVCSVWVSCGNSLMVVGIGLTRPTHYRTSFIELPYYFSRCA